MGRPHPRNFRPRLGLRRFQRRDHAFFRIHAKQNALRCHREAPRDPWPRPRIDRSQTAWQKNVNKSRITHLSSLLLFGITFVACTPPAPAPAPRPTFVPPVPEPQVRLSFPPRPADALEGQAFLESLADANENQVQQAALQELMRGNIPDSLRQLSRIGFDASTRSGQKKKVTIWVTWDYLSIGSEANSVRMALSPLTAQLVADQVGALLPTPKIVDVLYYNAETKLPPRPIAPSAWMVRPAEFFRHDKTIDEQLSPLATETRSWPPLLIAGHKKDIVLSNVLEEKSHRLAIYGWHTVEGKPIQPLSTYHGDWYADYSHGTRLIAKKMLIDGHVQEVEAVLMDEELAPLLSDEGPLVHTRYRTEDGPGRMHWWPKLPEESEESAKR